MLLSKEQYVLVFIGLNTLITSKLVIKKKVLHSIKTKRNADTHKSVRLPTS